MTSSSAAVSPAFKGRFIAEAGAKTEITVVGLGFFKLFVNGKDAVPDRLMPVTSFYHMHSPLYCFDRFGEEMKSRINVLRFDISSLVTAGENEVAALVGPGWYSEFSDCCVLCYRIVSGNTVTVSDRSLLWCDGPITSYRIHTGEMQDFTQYPFDGNLIPGEDAPWAPVRTVTLPETEYVLQDCPNDRVIRTVMPRKLGEADGFAVYDVGENISGTWVFRLPVRGRKVSVDVSEEIGEDGSPDMRWNHGQHAEIVTDGSDREYRLLFTWHAFRYFRIDADARVDCVEIIHTDLPVISSFTSENPVLNWFYKTFIRTQLCNMHAGIPSDCPHIERRGYTGDGQLTCETAMLTLDAEAFYRKWIGDISDCQDVHSGHVQYTAPYFRCGGGPGGWGCAIAEVPYQFFRTYGDIGPFRETYNQSLKYLAYLDAHSEDDLVVSDQPDTWCLGDWCTPHDRHGERPRIPAPFVNNYFYIRTCDRLLELAHLCGRDDAVDTLRAARKLRVEAIEKQYFDEKTGDFAENLNSANAFALDIGLGDNRTLANLVRHVREDVPDAGIFGYDLVVKQMFSHGYFDEAVGYLTREDYPSFGYMMHAGATTLWEEWKKPRSMSHPMFGSAVKYLFFDLLGIRQKEGTVGYTSLVIAPKTNRVTGNVSGSLRTPAGLVKVRVNHEEDTAVITVPKGIEYEVRFDGKVLITEE